MGNTALNIALPILSQDLAASSSQLQWMVDAYPLVFAGLLFTMSALGERYGRRLVMQLGLLLLGAVSLYAGLIATTANELIAVRALSGVAGAMIMPATLSILTNVFPPQERGRAIGVWTGIAGGGAAIGLLLSGFLLEHFAWQSLWMTVIPVVVVAFILGMALIPESRDPEQASFDIPGAVLSTAGVVALVYGLIEAPTAGWTSVQTLGTLLSGVVLLGAFAVWELRTRQPMLDVRLFAQRAFGVSALVLTLLFFTLMGLFFSIAQLFQMVMGYGAFESALRLTPILLFMIISAPLSPLLVRRVGVRPVAGLGLGMVAIGVGLMAMLGHTPTYEMVVVSMAVIAAGMGLVMTPATDLLMSAVPVHKAGMGSATNDTTRELGTALGVAVLGSIIASQYRDAIAPLAAGLGDQARAAVENSLGGALAVAQQVGGVAGAALATASRAAWMDGLSVAMVAGAVILGVTAVIALVGLPNRVVEPDLEAEPDGRASVTASPLPIGLALPGAE